MVSIDNLRKGIAIVLTLAVTLAYVPITAAHDLPEYLYVENAGQIFRMDLTDFLDNYQQVATGTGTLQITMSRAMLPGAPDARVSIFVFPEGTSEDIPVLGTTAEEVMLATGRDISKTQHWTEVVNYSFTSTETSYATSYRVGTDTFTMTVPKAALQRAAKDLAPDTGATIEVNGVVEYLDLATFHELAAHMSVTGELPTDYDLPPSLANLALEFDDLTMLVNGYQGFQLAAHTLRNRSLHVATKDDSCIHPCMSCAAMLLANVGTATAVIAACGSALATGGATVAACIAAFIAHNVTHFMTLGACANCYLCVTEPEPDECPCTGQPGCECG